jgi:hypothetical protein
MLSFTKLTLAAAALAVVAAVPAEAAKKKKKRPLPYCMPTIEASATGTGILGAGSAAARESARWNFQAIAADRYGPRYANFNNARNVRWDCKKNAILLAKCVVTARPCR